MSDEWTIAQIKKGRTEDRDFSTCQSGAPKRYGSDRAFCFSTSAPSAESESDTRIMLRDTCDNAGKTFFPVLSLETISVITMEVKAQKRKEIGLMKAPKRKEIETN